MRRTLVRVLRFAPALSLVAALAFPVDALASADCTLAPNSRVTFEVSAKGDELAFSVAGQRLLVARDATFRSGGAGFLIEGGTVPALGFSVTRL